MELEAMLPMAVLVTLLVRPQSPDWVEAVPLATVELPEGLLETVEATVELVEPEADLTALEAAELEDTQVTVDAEVRQITGAVLEQAAAAVAAVLEETVTLVVAVEVLEFMGLAQAVGVERILEEMPVLDLVDRAVRTDSKEVNRLDPMEETLVEVVVVQKTPETKTVMVELAR